MKSAYDITHFKENFKPLYSTSADFTLWVSRSHYIDFVVAQLRYTNTVSWATSSLLQQAQLVTNPGLILEFNFSK